MSERKLKAWEAAGLIDTATAARIRAWEAEHSRPLALWAVVGIAALAIGLGLISIVAANWDAIPETLRLAIHFALMAGAAGFLWFRRDTLAAQHPWLHEAALFIFAMLGMTFMGHLGQVYQTHSPLWQPLALWLVLFAPLLLLRGLGWPSAALVMAALATTVWNYATSLQDSHPGLSETAALLRGTAAISLPVLPAALAAWAGRQRKRDAFWRRLGLLAVGYAMGGASLIAIASAFDPWPQDHDAGLILKALGTVALFALATAGLIRLADRTALVEKAQAALLAGAAAIVLLAYPLSGSQLAAGLLFMALWCGIAAAGLFTGRRGVFQLAVAILALRLIVLSFELAGDLLTSGAGLIASGLLVLAIAWGALRVSKRFAPKREEQP